MMAGHEESVTECSSLVRVPIRQQVSVTHIATPVAKMSKGLFDACERGDIAKLRRLISNGLDPRKDIDNIDDSDVWWRPRTTPLHVASR